MKYSVGSALVEGATWSTCPAGSQPSFARRYVTVETHEHFGGRRSRQDAQAFRSAGSPVPRSANRLGVQDRRRGRRATPSPGPAREHVRAAPCQLAFQSPAYSKSRARMAVLVTSSAGSRRTRYQGRQRNHCGCCSTYGWSGAGTRCRAQARAGFPRFPRRATERFDRPQRRVDRRVTAFAHRSPTVSPTSSAPPSSVLFGPLRRTRPIGWIMAGAGEHIGSHAATSEAVQCNRRTYRAGAPVGGAARPREQLVPAREACAHSRSTNSDCSTGNVVARCRSGWRFMIAA